MGQTGDFAFSRVNAVQGENRLRLAIKDRQTREQWGKVKRAWDNAQPH